MLIFAGVLALVVVCYLLYKRGKSPLWQGYSKEKLEKELEDKDKK